ncbi:MAG TPA: ATP synthase F0 subunit C [Candidatus Kerfeldbacteria bacterium]|nr:ATP synthase F0 subunit C [Candidatus Kerfeldbacteria bacterium]
MDIEVAKMFAAGAAVALGCAAPAIAQGMMVSRAMESIGRNPSIEGSIFSKLVITMAITESLGIYSLVIALLILFV